MFAIAWQQIFMRKILESASHIKTTCQIRYRGVSNTKQDCVSLTIKNLKNSKKKIVSALARKL